MKAISCHSKAALLASMFLGLTAAPAFPQSAGSGSPAAPPQAGGSPPPAIHYHYHLHVYGNVPMPSLVYPNYATPYTMGTWNSYYPMPPDTAPPTAARPYPPGYILGPYAPLGFPNAAPGAPSAQGVIHVFLPTGRATVYLNGQKMRGTGKDRKITTAVLQPNKEYQYWVTATFEQNGEKVTQYRKVILGAGEYNVADFTRPREENPIHLPAGPVDPNTVAPDK